MILLGLTRWVLRHRALVIVGWLALTVGGAIAVTPATRAMTADFGALPGRPGYETNQRILHDYGNGGATDPLVLTVTLPPGSTVDSPGIPAELAAAFGGAVAAVGDARLISYPTTGDRALVSADGRSTFALLYPPAAETYPPYAEAIPRLNQALSNLRVAGAPVELTGTDALFVQSSDAPGRACSPRPCSPVPARCWCWPSSSVPSWRSSRWSWRSSPSS
ncbi:hypothetical protein [Actinoplanes sp. ATCC 53533]|uniref:hypothetical protein n=1 Tax=Actinoplanes sp. ATCC 53533 TaxID=1288362 RepID=UPI0018F27C29|nr:hypothetical protein [Actinoplanes sp. ATCC 53533]